MNDTTEGSDVVVGGGSTNNGYGGSSSSSSSHSTVSYRSSSLTIAGIGVVASLMNNETDSEAVVASSSSSASANGDNINLTSSPVSATMSSMHRTTQSAIDVPNRIASQAQPLVMVAPTIAGEPMNNGAATLDEISSSVNVTNATASSITRPCKC